MMPSYSRIIKLAHGNNYISVRTSSYMASDMPLEAVEEPYSALLI